jgi:hypothetical protein
MAESGKRLGGQTLRTLESEFDALLEKAYYTAKTEADYHATYFIQMLHRDRGVSTALYLIGSSKVSEGFTALWERGRLDLTVEALVFDNERFHPLFSEADVKKARARLKEYKYAPAK